MEPSLAVEHNGKEPEDQGSETVKNRKIKALWKFSITFWVIASVISLLGVCFMFREVKIKWQNSPVIVKFVEKPISIFELPFPAVTICPQTKVRSEFLNFTEAYLRLRSKKEFRNASVSDAEIQIFAALTQVCDKESFESFDNLEYLLEGSEIIQLLHKISPGSQISKCTWAVGQNCSDFTEILTKEGLCHTFNALESSKNFKTSSGMSPESDSQGWSLENGYSSSQSNVYPRRALAPGEEAGLDIHFKLRKSDLDFGCRGPVQGFKVILHTPDEIPRASKNYFRVSLEQEVVVGLKPNLMMASEGLVFYNPEQRECFFEGERKLQFFQVYSQSNCELECLAEFTRKSCSCVRFFMPRKNGTRICGHEDLKCYKRAEMAVLLKEVECNCLPACTSLSYDTEISQASFVGNSNIDSPKKLLLTKLNELSDDFRYARLKIFFKEAQFLATKRSESFEFSDFIGGSSGVLGLFLGFLILSLIEILYLTMVRQKYKSGSAT